MSDKKINNKIKPVEAQFSENHVWKVFKAYAQENTLVDNQIDSFNYFVNFGMQEIVDQESTIIVPNYKVKFEHISLAPPQVIEEDRSLCSVYPNNARRRDLNYDSAILCDITETFDDKEVKKHHRVVIGRMPIMLKSSICNLNKLNKDEQIQVGECPKDIGGYFIIKGNERVLVAQVRAVYNQVFVLKQKTGEKYKWIAETRSMSDETGHSVLLQAMIGNNDRSIDFSLPYIKEPIPVGVVFKALGFTKEDDIEGLIGFESEKAKKYIKFILRDSYFCETREDALEYIGKYAMHVITENKEKEYAKQIVESEILPHLGISGTILEYACFLGKMIKKLIMTHVEERSEDDRDNYTNRRVETAGTLIYEIFRNLFKKYTQFIKAQLEKRKQRPDIISIISRIKSITKGLHQCLATGNWTVQKNASYMRTGVSQVLDRMTYLSTLSHLRRVIIPMGKEGKNTAIRQIHSSSYGFICPCETPEGESVGTVLNFSLFTKITKKISKVLVKSILEKCKTIIPVENIEIEEIKNLTAVFLNGSIVGYSKDHNETIEEIKIKRDQGLLDKEEISISYDIIDNDIRVFCDEGRFTRPLLTLLNNKLNIKGKNKYTWSSLIREGKIQYVDAAEIENCVIAMSREDLEIQYNDFCEIHPCTMLGIMAAMIIFPDHSQSPRNCYQCIDRDTPVLMGDRTMKKIGDIKVGETVVTFDENMKYSTTKVIYHQESDTEKDMYLVETISGRQIKATFDHKFMTNKGWLQVQDFDKDTKVAIYLQSLMEINEIERNLILDKEQFEHILSGKMTDKLIKYHSEKLSHILPLYSNSKYIPILARMFGILLTDGSTNIYKKNPQIQLTLGNKESVQLFEEDVITLGFDSNKISYSEAVINGYTHTGYTILYNNAVASLMITLGIMCGRRTTQEQKCIPEWIMNGSKSTKREFIAGFQGGDGCKIRCNLMTNGNHNYVCAATYLSKVPEYAESLRIFMIQMKTLISEFGIEVQAPVETNGKNGKIQIGYKISDKQDNLVKYYENIGYRYDTYKITESGLVIEYLKYKNKFFENYFKLHNDILVFHENGKTNTEISRILSIPINKVSDRIKSFKNGRKISAPKLPEKCKFEWWKNNVEIKDSTIFIPVNKISIEKVRIADITTESNNHSFVANSFCIHNSSMGKQALGIPALSYNLRTDTLLHVLHYPQRPIVCTKAAEIFGINEMPSGINAIVAIASYSGFNQEDSVMLNLSAIQRGLFCLTSYHTIDSCEKKRDTYSFEEIVLPPKNSEPSIKQDQTGYFKRKRANYSLLDENGVVRPRERFDKELGKWVGPATVVQKGDVIIGKVLVSSSKTSDEVKTDASVVIQPGEEGIIDRVHVTITPNGYKLVKVVIRITRQPSLGDKLASRAAQKGTIGMVYRQEDMPFTASGICPDIIINPCCIPSRMTINQLIECALGKECSISGTYGDCTPFTESSINAADKLVNKISDNIQDYGFQSQGWETMYNGMTGEMINAKIFMGPTYYQRLKHMVDDKMHARAKGHVTMLTRQPLEGRARDGGLRFGEMEHDCCMEDSLISLNCGLSIKIKNINCPYTVLSFSEKGKGIVSAPLTNFIYKGERECLKIFFEDGTFVEATEEHPFLIDKNIWTKSKDLLGKRVKCSVTGPEIMYDCIGKEWKLGEYSIDTLENILKSLSFCRLLGFILTDGTISKQEYSSTVYFGHKIDGENILDDIFLLTEKIPIMGKTKNIYRVGIPSSLTKFIKSLKGIVTGKRVNQESTLPEFILDPNCPEMLVREFLAGMFGGDGHCPALAGHTNRRKERDQITSISFSQTKSESQLDNLYKYMECIKTLLIRVGINEKSISIQKHRETTSSKDNKLLTSTEKHYSITLHINVNQLIKFSEIIGFRYCCHKVQRLSLAVSYRRLRENTAKQTRWIIERVRQLTSYVKGIRSSISIKKMVEQAHEELKKIEPIYNEYYSLPSYEMVRERLKRENYIEENFDKMKYDKFPTPEAYLKSIGAYDCFLDKINKENGEVTYGIPLSSNSLPVYNLKVISIVPVGLKPVYDVQVDETHNFIANGAVAHNCMIAQGNASFLKERLFQVSDAFQITVCKNCGIMTSKTNECQSCKGSTVATCNFPYASKLLHQELTAMCLKVSLKVDE